MSNTFYEGLCGRYQAVPTANHSVPVAMPGEVAPIGDKREYMYCKASESLAFGEACIPAAYMWSGSVSVIKASSDTTKTIITCAAAGWTVNAFAGALMFVEAGTGAGQVPRFIKENSATTLTLYEPLDTALSVADSYVKIWAPWYVAKAANTSKIQTVIGAAQNTVTATRWFWMAVKGDWNVIVGVKCTTATVAGTRLMAGGAAGQLQKVGTEETNAVTPVGTAIDDATVGNVPYPIIG